MSRIIELAVLAARRDWLDERAARAVAREPLSWVGEPVAINVIRIPIFPQQETKQEMTTAEKLAYMRQHLPAAVTDYSRGSDAKFDPRPVFTNAAVHALFPSRATDGDDFSDDRSNSPRDDDTTEHSNLGMAADLINCEISGESGPGCGHNGVDHVGAAIDCLQNYSHDQAMRDKNLTDASNAHTVRFA